MALGAVLAPAALAVNSGRVEYYHRDALDNVRVVTDENGQVLERHDYLPFGEECTTGACAPNPGMVGGQPRRFTGKERDPETGHDYFGARYYSQRVGRFTTIDPHLGHRAALVDPQRWNRYAYGRNNPLRYVDPDGRDAIDYVGGVANAFGSNFFAGAGRAYGGNADFQFGQFVGDVISIPAGGAWAQAGAGTAGLGVAASAPSGGVSLVATAGGVVSMAQGGVAALAGFAHAGAYLSKNTTAGSDMSASGQATDKYGNKLGPSGKPMVHETQSNTREAARNKALNDGVGAVEHGNPKHGKPHFHATDLRGEKKPASTHHNYPKK